MPQIHGVQVLLAVFATVALWYIRRWWVLEHGRGRLRELRPTDLTIGGVTNFFDTLGIGCFAPTTAVYKLQRRMDDAEIPGTLNVGHALPCLTEALIFVAIITLDLTTLVSMIGAAVLGAWLGAGIVARAPRRVIQIGMGLALLSAALLLLAKNLPGCPQPTAARSGCTAAGCGSPWGSTACSVPS